MDKLLFDYFADSVGMHVVATTLMALGIVKLMGDEQVVLGARRFIAFLEPDPATMFRGPDWLMRPLAAASMTVYTVGATYMALCATLAAWAAGFGNAGVLKPLMAFALFMFGMALCVRTARASFERTWPRTTA